MSIVVINAMTIICSTFIAASEGSATGVLVDLAVRPRPQTVSVGDVVEVELYAVSDDGTEQIFSGLDVLLSWDPTALKLRDEAVASGPHNWSFVFGFLSDEFLDGLNADCGADVFCDPYTGIPFNDGNALFQAASFSPATATKDGLLIATLLFTAQFAAPKTEVVIEAQFGEFSSTRVLQPGAVDVTGSLGRASITVLGPMLSAADLVLPAGRTAEVWVSGEIAGQETIGVTLLVEIASRPGNTGTVEYTPAPPVDITQLGDPWPKTGSFTPFDTDRFSFSETFNGAIDGDGSFLGAPLTYAGLLSAFPIAASSDARGVWDIRLCRNSCATEFERSSWNALAGPPRTALRHGTLRIVDRQDGNGDGAIDMRDFRDLQVCYTDAVGPADPAAYSLAPALRCVVYDFDGDGAIDGHDFAAFHGTMSGPLQSSTQGDIGVPRRPSLYKRGEKGRN